MPREAAEIVILIVEDNSMISEGMRAQLVKNGYKHVETAANAESALRLIEARVPGFALLDVSLGRGATSESVASDLQRRDVPFAFVTGYGEQADFSKRFPQAMMLQKPAKIEDLLAVIRQTT